MRRIQWLLATGNVLITLAFSASAQQPPPATPIVEPAHFDLARPDIRAYIEQAVTLGVDRVRLMSLLSAAEPQQKIIDAITKPAEKTLQWWEYRARMLTPLRIEAGATLWREHKELLDRIAVEYQVAPEYLIAVLGVETQYGRVTGRYRVLDALTTLGFDYPTRASYFQSELTQYLLLAREEGFDPLSIRGSYAGAMGALQFMPSSYRKFAVSGRHASHRDLWGDWGDIFASTANYLHQAGWQYGGPVLAEAQLAPDQSVTPPERMVLNETLGGLRSHALTIPSTLPDDTPAVLLAAPQQDAMGYRVGFQNFYVITRYNSSPLYAMAVYDLAQAVKQQLIREAAM
ncbi:MAG TPA: lytic murein transglycosylase B [Steroidobacteraceae bacterium]|jgi:membrane-bound lytic murein transglycosylase B|nr:lytic murein transglycosylase B [Steroidobacteraceae bacterium]